jgi:hypothetical protein
MVLLACILAGCIFSKPEPPAKRYAQGDPLHSSESSAVEGEDVASPLKPPAVSIPPQDRQGGLTLTIRAQDSAVKAGQKLYFTVSLRNTTVNTSTVAYPSEKRFDVVVFADEALKIPVYVHSQTTLYAELFQEVILGPGSNTTRVIDVPTTSLLGDDAASTDVTLPLRPGSYWVCAVHDAIPVLGTKPLAVQVQE